MPVADQFHQFAPRTRRVFTAGPQRPGEVLEAVIGTIRPAFDLGGGPGRALILMALIAGIGGAQAHGKIRSRHAQAVVVAHIHFHVGARRHVAGHTLSTGGTHRVMMMLRRVVAAGLVALGADRIAFGAQLSAVRVVAIAASDALVVHAALQERTVFEDLALDLPIDEIQRRIQQSDTLAVSDRLAVGRLFIERCAEPVTAGAGFHFAVLIARPLPHHQLTLLIVMPVAQRPGAEIHRQTAIGYRF